MKVGKLCSLLDHLMKTGSQTWFIIICHVAVRLTERSGVEAEASRLWG
jgi:hypothetical protein